MRIAMILIGASTLLIAAGCARNERQVAYDEHLYMYPIYSDSPANATVKSRATEAGDDGVASAQPLAGSHEANNENLAPASTRTNGSSRIYSEPGSLESSDASHANRLSPTSSRTNGLSRIYSEPDSISGTNTNPPASGGLSPTSSYGTNAPSRIYSETNFVSGSTNGAVLDPRSPGTNAPIRIYTSTNATDFWRTNNPQGANQE